MKPLPASIREKNRLNLISLNGKKQSQLFGVTSLLALAACRSKQGTSNFRTTTDKTPTVATQLQDATVVGNDTIIDLDGVFGNGNGNLTLAASLGSVGTDKMLTLSDHVFTEGTHTIILTATDADGDTAKETVELTSDKTPTVATVIDNATLAVGNDGTTIDVSSVFANGSGVLSITVSTGTITGGMLTLSGVELADGTNTIMLTATDADLINPDSVSSTFVITTDKSPTVTTATIEDKTLAANNDGITIDVSGVFGHPTDGEVLTLSASTGTITDDMLTLAEAELADGANTIMLTATDADLINPDSVTSTFVITTNQSPTITTAIADDRRATNHSNTTIDLTKVFANGNGTLTYAVTAPTGVSTANSALIINYGELGVGTHSVTVTATDSDADSITDEFMLEVVKLNGNSSGSASLLGTTYVDAINGNTFTRNDNFYPVNFDGGADNDTISNNTLTAGLSIYSVTLDGGVGNDTISNNTLTAGHAFFTITFAGDDGNDTISSNTLTASDLIRDITFDGGAGNDTISNNTLTASLDIYTVTFDGGVGNDTISDNHFESSSTDTARDVYDISLMGGAGDDVFRDNTATQANGELSSITIDGGADTDGLDTDKVYFDLASNLFTITGGYGSQITVIDIAKRVNAGGDNDVNSYARYDLIDIEELFFNGTLYEFS